MTTSLPEHRAAYARGAALTGIDRCRPLSTRHAGFRDHQGAGSD